MKLGTNIYGVSPIIARKPALTKRKVEAHNIKQKSPSKLASSNPKSLLKGFFQFSKYASLFSFTTSPPLLQLLWISIFVIWLLFLPFSGRGDLQVSFTLLRCRFCSLLPSISICNLKYIFRDSVSGDLLFEAWVVWSLLLS